MSGDAKKAGIVFVTEVFPRPSESFILRDLSGLMSLGLDFQVICLEKGEPGILERFGLPEEVVVVTGRDTARRASTEKALRMPGIKGWMASRRHRAEAGAVAAAAMEVPFKVTRVHALFAGLPVYLARAAAEAIGAPLSVSIHAGDVYLGAEHYHALLPEAEFITGCNQCVMDFLAEKRPELTGKLKLVRHGLPAERDAPEAPSWDPEGEVRLLAVGRLVEKKGFPVLIAALKVLLEGGISARLTLVGDGPDRRPYKIAKRLGVLDRVAFTGWIEGGVAAAVKTLGPFHALVVPSIVDGAGDRDGVPNVIPEAWSIGLPVVAASTGGIGEVAVDGENAVVVPPGNPGALALGIGRLVRDPELAGRIVAGGWTTLKEEFDPARNVAAWAELLM